MPPSLSPLEQMVNSDRVPLYCSDENHRIRYRPFEKQKFLRGNTFSHVEAVPVSAHGRVMG